MNKFKESLADMWSEWFALLICFAIMYACIYFGFRVTFGQ